MRKCTCGSGDAKTLEVLRSTSMADMPLDEFNEIVDAVNAAGGVSKTIGLPRVLITKAIHAFNAGVAKGDYVGHPFRGNQHVDGSGAGRGGSGGPRDGGAGGSRGRASTGAASRRRRGQFTAEERRLQALNDTLDPRAAGRRNEAEALVVSMTERQAEVAAEDIARDIEGVANIQRAAEQELDDAERALERASSYDEDEKSQDEYRLATRIRSKVVAFAKQTGEALKRAQQMVERVRKALSDAADLREAQEKAAVPLRSARDTLLKLDRQLADTAETARRMGRSGFGSAHSSAAAQIGFLRAGIRSALDSLADTKTEIDGMGDAALEVEQTIYEDERDGQ